MAFPPDTPRDDDGRFADEHMPVEDWSGWDADPDDELEDPLFVAMVFTAVSGLGLGLLVAAVEGSFADAWLFWLISAVAGVAAMAKVFLEDLGYDDDDDDPVGPHEVRF